MPIIKPLLKFVFCSLSHLRTRQTGLNQWSDLIWVGIETNCAVNPLKEIYSEVIVGKGATNNCGHCEVTCASYCFKHGN